MDSIVGDKAVFFLFNELWRCSLKIFFASIENVDQVENLCIIRRFADALALKAGKNQRVAKLDVEGVSVLFKKY